MRKSAKKSGKSAGWVLLVLCVLLAGTVALRAFAARRQTPAPEPLSAAAFETAAPPEAAPPAAAAQAQETSPAPAGAEVSEPAPFIPPKGYTQETYALVSDMVYAYASLEEASADTVAADLEKLRTLDGALADFWGKLMRCWRQVNTTLTVEKGVLPDGLPEDDSLCIVVLGFQLEADGGMSPELVGRCETALASAQKYPNALIAVTGGGTAWQNPAATEAGAMAAWLTAHGVAQARILKEDASRTTAENAIFTGKLLRESCPQVKTLAIVSSDYHIPLGVLLFQEEALLYEYETGVLPFTVTANAAWDTGGLVSADTPMMQKTWLWSIADPHY